MYHIRLRSLCSAYYVNDMLGGFLLYKCGKLMSKDCICKEMCLCYGPQHSDTPSPLDGGGVLQLVSERIRVNDSVTVSIRV